MPSKKTHEEFVNELKKIQPKLLVVGEYINTNSKILIKDENNIEYYCYPQHLIRGKKPSPSSVVNKDLEFIKKLKLVFPNLELIDKYTTLNTKVKVKNIKNGHEFFILPKNLYKDITPEYYDQKYSDDKTENFKIKLALLQPNLKLIGEYKGSKTKITVIDEFNNEYNCFPHEFLSVKKNILLTRKNQEKPIKKQKVKIDHQTNFIGKAIKKHGKTFNYKDVIYVNTKEKVKIICSKHGEFLQTPNNHLAGRGCLECSLEKKRLPLNEFLNKAKFKHGDKYDYTHVNYTYNDDKVKIICPIHGEFLQILNNHLNGKGCSMCGKEKTKEHSKNRTSGFSLSAREKVLEESKSGVPKIYLIECYNENENFLKVGFTITDIKRRFKDKSRLPYKYNIIYTHNSSMEYIYNLETLVKREFKNNKYIPELSFGGHMECFSISILDNILNFIKNKTINTDDNNSL